MFQYNEFTGECTYCYETVYNMPIVYCTCSTEMCPSHIDCHGNSTHKRISISATRNNSLIEVTVDDFGTGIDKKETKNKIKQALAPARLERNKLKQCPHIKSVDKIVISTDKCTKCPIDTNTWACIRCSEVFCGRKQYGIEGNGHGVEHNEKNKECTVFIKVQSIDSTHGLCDAYCYECDDIVSHSLFSKIENTLEKNKKDLLDSAPAALNMFDLENKLLNTKAEDLQLSPPVEGSSLIPYAPVRTEGGILDLGNSCYISSILQAVACSLSGSMEVLHPLYEIDCERPKDCFGCQFKKAMEHIVLSHHRKVDTFSVDRLCSIVQEVYPRYVSGTQQDASEYLTDLLTLIAGYDEMGHFSGIFDRFRIKQEISVICKKCDNNNTQEEAVPMLYIGTEQKIQDIFEEEELPAICHCGNKKSKITSIINHPKTFTVAIKRDISEGTNPPIETRITLLDKDKKKVSYELESAVIHKGTIQAGHYVTQVPLHDCPMGSEIYKEYKETRQKEQDKKDTTNKKHKTHEIVPKDLAWVVYDNAKVGIDELFSSSASILFYRLATK